MPDSPLHWILLILASLAAGAVNAVAGGGTLLTFPPLTAVMPKVFANGTSTVALLPGTVASVWGYRRELQGAGRLPLLLILPSLIGGLIGAGLVTRFPPKYFDAAVPWLILSAALLFLLQPTMLRLSYRRRSDLPAANGRSVMSQSGLWIAQFLIAIYGGYFGAGIGILMLSALGLMGVGDIHRMNAVKTVLASVINVVAAIVFVMDGKVIWAVAGVMAIGAIIGGYLGAHFGRRLPRPVVRWIVIVIGFGLAAKYFYEQNA